jgi:transcriptional regulator with XRE-family HTH domain
MGKKSLREIREERGLTQKQIASALGISQGYVQKFESGKLGASKHRDAILRHLGVREEDVVVAPVRGRGRPLGSKNPESIAQDEDGHVYW